MSNVTLKIDDDLLQQVRIIAAKNNSSISSLLSSYIENIVRNDEEYQVAKERAVRRLEKGWDLGWTPVPRDEMHER